MLLDLTVEEIKALRSLLTGNGTEIHTLATTLKQRIVLKCHVALEELNSLDSQGTATLPASVPPFVS